jgi:hypothetical protein
MPGKKNKAVKKTQPIRKEDIQKNPDKHIDQDFKGYPHPPAADENIRPITKTEKLNAGVIKKEAPKKKTSQKAELRKELEDTDEQDSDGSGGAFSGTEEILPMPEEDDDDQKIY